MLSLPHAPSGLSRPAQMRPSSSMLSSSFLPQRSGIGLPVDHSLNISRQHLTRLLMQRKAMDQAHKIMIHPIVGAF